MSQAANTAFSATPLFGRNRIPVDAAPKPGPRARFDCAKLVTRHQGCIM
jgi:hypothetical protein